MKVVEKVMTRICLRKDSDLILVFSKYSFGNRVIGNWNSLSADCVHCKTVNTFKKHLSPALESGAV